MKDLKNCVHACLAHIAVSSVKTIYALYACTESTTVTRVQYVQKHMCMLLSRTFFEELQISKKQGHERPGAPYRLC